VFKKIELKEGSDFISFDDLSNDIVFGWLKDAIGQNKVYELQNSVLSALQDKVTPEYVTMTIGDYIVKKRYISVIIYTSVTFTYYR